MRGAGRCDPRLPILIISTSLQNGTMARVALLGTCDTKLEELLFLRNVICTANVEVVLVDVGRSPVDHESITVSQADLLRNHAGGKSVFAQKRGDVVKIMADCATKTIKSMFEESSVHGIVAAGGRSEEHTSE